MDEPHRSVFADVEVIGRGRVDVSVQAGGIVAIGAAEPGSPTIAGHGRVLLPGLHDHHLHVLAAAAARTSVHCGPPQVRDITALARALATVRPHRGWIRGVGYHEAVAGELDATSLDRITRAVPTRVQHRSGALWMVNGLGVQALHLDDVQLTGVERDAGGRPTGRLWRMDDWLRERIGGDPSPDVAGVSSELARYGVTGVTDATADLSADAVQMIVTGGLEQRLLSLGVDVPDGVSLGPRKMVVADHRLPSFGELADQVRAARPRPVALHCVTRTALALTLAVLGETGTRPGDRIEHAAVCPPELAAGVATLGVTVVTQPVLVRQRGDDYLDDVDADDRPFLWPFASLLAAGVHVGCSSDAPYGGLNPWASIAAAAERRSATGRPVAAAERVDAWTALRGYLSPLEDPGGPPRAVTTGAAADLCLLDRPLAEALRAPDEVEVLLTVLGGRFIHSASVLAGRS
jgi:predicted amidohydrolase YtcJ